jgi:hypothetical protein
VIESLAPRKKIEPDDILRIGQHLRCPVCENTLVVDVWWSSPHWICTENHSYSNVRVLIAELRERGWLPEQSPNESQVHGCSATTIVPIGPVELHPTAEERVPDFARARMAR